MNFDRKLKKLDHRNWDSIKGNWLKYLPELETAGQAPDSDISENPSLLVIIPDVPKDGELKREVLGLRTSIFHVGLYQFHKAINVGGSSELNIEHGFLSWSLSSAYQAAFFSVKAILSFLGIGIVDVNNKMILVDIWTEPDKLSNNQLKKGLLPDQETKFLCVPRLQHYHVWEIFQRILRVSEVNIWDIDYINFIRQLSPKDFAYQRNILHYKNAEWILDDLHERMHDPIFGNKENLLLDLHSLENDNKDFTVYLSYILTYFAYSLIKDISNSAPILMSEVELIDTKLLSPSRAKFRNSIAI